MDSWSLASAWLVNWAFFVGRYAAMAGVVSGLVWLVRRQRFGACRIEPQGVNHAQVKREVMWSVASAAIFVTMGLITMLAGASGYTRMYWEVAEYGWPWLIASVPVMVLLHDAYFYWVHRLMHGVAPWQRAHALHHESHHPTPWSAFAFHPGEALLAAGILPLLALTIPLHPSALLAFSTVMCATSVVIHSGCELFPRPFRTGALGGWLMTATLHGSHHGGVRGNYGLYFLAWDRWMGSLVDCDADRERCCGDGRE